MFTGIIEEMGTIASVRTSGTGREITISASLVVTDMHVGDSVAVNGVCQTVTSFTADSFTFFTSTVTASITTLGTLGKGDPVNLERALALGRRLGGHIVQGHVDGTGRIAGIHGDASGITVTVATSAEILDAVIDRGSICVDGISLTVTEAGRDAFTLYIIPETVRATTASMWRSGSTVNIETDILGKYVRKFTVGGRGDRLMNALAENGFL